jgi:hypothetical protein
MCGRELAEERGSLRAKIYYYLLGHDQIGIRVRAFHFKKALRNLKAPKKIWEPGIQLKQLLCQERSSRVERILRKWV